MQYAEAVANEFMKLAEHEQCSDFSPMKVQKLVYYAHGWHLGLFDTPLIREAIQAWKWGPVVPELYHEFREFGNEPIDRRARNMRWKDGDLAEFEPEVDNDQAKSLVAQIWKVYGGYSPVQLSNLTHENGSPWDMVAKRFNYNIPFGIDIPNDLIQEYFKKQAAESRPS